MQEVRCSTRLVWGGGKGRVYDRLGRNGRECRCYLSPGIGLDRLECLRRRLPEWGCKLCPLLGQMLLSIRLYLQESDRQRQSADALQDLIKLTGFCFWRLLTPFYGRGILHVFFLLYFSFGTVL